jgi:hypothetical protein
MFVADPSPAIWDGLIGAVVGAVIAGAASALVLMLQLRADRKRRDKDKEDELISLATALLCEIWWFYVSAVSFNVQASLAKIGEKMPLSFTRPPMNFITFTVFESNANKIGLFEADTAEKVVEFVYDAKLYLALAQEHKRRLLERDVGRVPYLHEKPIESTLQSWEGQLDAKIGPLAEALRIVAQNPTLGSQSSSITVPAP